MRERLTSLRPQRRRDDVGGAPPDDRLVRIEQATAGADLRAAIEEFSPEVILADVFDTLLVRRVHPEDVKRLAARQLAVRLDLATRPTDLYAMRHRLERQLCLDAAERGLDMEFRLRELGSAMFNNNLERLDPAVRNLGEQAWVDELVSVELEVERQVQELDQHVVVALDEHVARGGRLVLVSDFYLARDDLVALLANAGFGPDRYERLFVSSETLVTKRGGALYDQVLAELRVPPPRLLMVGDNEHSDGRMAQTRGIRAIVLRRDHQRARYAALARRCSRLITLSASIDEVLGHDPAPSSAPDVFPELALTLAYAVVRLHEALHRDGQTAVLFLAREGQLLERLVTTYDNLITAPERRLTTSYAYVSRRATFLPSLGPLADERFPSLFRQYRTLTVREFLLNLGFDADAAGSIATSAGLDPDVVHADLPTSEAFAGLLSDVDFRTAYEQRRRRG